MVKTPLQKAAASSNKCDAELISQTSMAINVSPGADLEGGALEACPPFWLVVMWLFLGYKTWLLNMSTTKKIDDYFQRELEQTAKKRIVK